MSNRYIIEATEEQLAGIKHALACARREYQEELPKRKEGVAFWEAMNPSAPEREKYLAMSRENLADVERQLALVKAASPAVYGAKLKTARTRRGRS